ncbi:MULTISPECIES: dipicolinate synthase subunit B [Aneurinibacillus]|uniref:Dipicolinate synthase subunit B n=1 Tax=Aneurinibacillus thermoaerophilus TaxID=143495 RepID=A0A1G7WGY7_ANETH|nr:MULTISPECIES: dipicolinate synthase subunit B [Aneurinibacillus]AMA72719.1 dipicolinate synthase subunit B [Aneurinibacillus sp. XH2]MED0674558.1 dipicolinate synthase subunit B [Aneurinibacillus thermoaerophilus]MED0677927.1 dipicolinate synthase subunit B [Aneurinibacillus thermoaerophilus]MED0737010.1 dipicolinate synthase subunit B [Aneurinibacillus thermoaerophilus]MED0756851.1 dipicolinate synthase subunit B [Aneurinibacillus thermoaerophilus]
MDLKGKTIGFGLTGSHCTFAEVMPEIQRLVDAGANIIPVISHTVATTDTRFGNSSDWQAQLRAITGNEIISTIVDAEPFGPSKKLDLMIIAPCTGTSISKLANAMTDSAVMMATKATLRNLRPVVIAISTNDGLGLNAANIAKLVATKNIYMVPYGQDAPDKKPNSLVARMELLKETCEAALEGRQLQPMLVEKYRYMQ